MGQDILREMQFTWAEPKITNYTVSVLEVKRADFIPLTYKDSRARGLTWANKELGVYGLKLVTGGKSDNLHRMSAIVGSDDHRPITEILTDEDSRIALFSQSMAVVSNEVGVDINMDNIRKLGMAASTDIMGVIGVQTRRLLTAVFHHKTKPDIKLNLKWKGAFSGDEANVAGHIRNFKGGR